MPNGNECYKWVIRMMGIDTPEMKTKNTYEKQLAIKARDFLRELILDKFIIIECLDFDKYGRLLANIYIEGNAMSISNMMIEKGQIEIAPLSFIRGRSFNNSFVIVDEAQNTTIHELKTIVTRVGENTKIVLMGDTDQVDTPYIDSKSNGLTIAIDKLKSSDLVSHIHLPKGERSKLATFCSKVL
jgi:hypothetical protein